MKYKLFTYTEYKPTCTMVSDQPRIALRSALNRQKLSHWSALRLHQLPGDSKSKHTYCMPFFRAVGGDRNSRGSTKTVRSGWDFQLRALKWVSHPATNTTDAPYRHTLLPGEGVPALYLRWRVSIRSHSPPDQTPLKKYTTPTNRGRER